MYAIELWEPETRKSRYVKYTKKGAIAVDKLSDATSFATKDEATRVAEGIAAPTIARVLFLAPHPPEGGCSEPGV